MENDCKIIEDRYYINWEFLYVQQTPTNMKFLAFVALSSVATAQYVKRDECNQAQAQAQFVEDPFQGAQPITATPVAQILMEHTQYPPNEAFAQYAPQPPPQMPPPMGPQVAPQQPWFQESNYPQQPYYGPAYYPSVACTAGRCLGNCLNRIGRAFTTCPCHVLGALTGLGHYEYIRYPIPPNYSYDRQYPRQLDVETQAQFKPQQFSADTPQMGTVYAIPVNHNDQNCAQAA
ncbi:hypothetical protein DASB73_032420 [Starmerella bacillaris]|uniref:Uncharacterized protein n=1 Tax=Starmerella bacillaris TaxID=1247836 RepID=A0AAV5RP36_STABA|nr:hypothetical protein DASB73_032420 [Starmerella bacillaris]